jgi:hypothetical protein
MPKMKHPASSHRIDVAPDQVAMYESQGWQLVSAPAARRAARKKSTNKADSAATTKE